MSEQMGHPYELRPDMSVTDIAFCILKSRGQRVHFKELIAEIMQVKAISKDNPGRLIAQMHTEINLDSRFLHYGNGEWGLREWQPKGSKVIKIRPETPVAPRKSALRLEEEEREEDEDAAEEEEEDTFGADESETSYEQEREDEYEDDEE